MFARTPSRSFGRRLIRDRCFATSPHMFGFTPRSGSDLILKQFRDTPDMVGESGRHSWGTRMPKMFGCAQLVMRKAKIVATSDQIYSLCWLLGTSVLQNERRTAFFHCSRLQLSEGFFVHFRLSVMICVQFVKKLFFKCSCFERARATLLQLYASSALQRNGNNHTVVYRFCCQRCTGKMQVAGCFRRTTNKGVK